MVYSKKPLMGRSIIVTRASAQSSSFSKLLQSCGAKVFQCPTIRIVNPKSFKPLDQAIQNLHAYDWLIFTSANGVEKFMERLKRTPTACPPRFIGGSNVKMERLKTCAIGPATAQKMKQYKIPVTKISKQYVAESILDVLPNVKGNKILIPRAEIARDVLPKELTRRGAQVDAVDAYRTVVDHSQARRLKKLISKGSIDCITFTSSSTVKNFFALLSLEEREKILHNNTIQAASIGPITTGTLKEFGWIPVIIAKESTTQDLASAITKYYEKNF